MIFKKRIGGKPRKRRGLSSVVGSVFFIIVFSSAAGYAIYSMNQIDKFGEAIIGKSQDTLNKNNEAFVITGVTKDNNKFNITIQNTGQLPVNITRLWVQNKTDPTWPTSKFAINQIVSSGQTLTKVGQTLQLTAKPTQGYDLSVVSERGNIQEFLVNSASQKPLYLQLFVLPGKVPTGYSTSLLFAVTNNMSNNGILTNLVPNLVIAAPPGASATLVSGPDPPTYPILKSGNTAFFKWIYNIAGNNGQAINFTASIQNGYLANSVLQNATITAQTAGYANIIKKTATYTATVADDVIAVNTTNTNPTIINLPDATTVKGKIFWIKKDDTSGNTLKIAPFGSQTIDGNGTLSIFNNKVSVFLQSDGSNYIQINRTPDDVNSFRVMGSTQNRFYGSGLVTYTENTITATTGSIFAFPFPVPKTIKVDRIQLEVTTLGTSSTCRMGIYTDSGNQVPANLVSGSDAGAVTTSTTGVKTNTLTNVILYGGNLYWLSYQCSTTAPILRSVPTSTFPNILGMVNTMGGTSTGIGWSNAQTYGAMPSTFPSGSTVVTSATTQVPEILVRIAG